MTRKHTANYHEFIQKIADAELWDEADNGMDASGGVTYDFQEWRENEAQDWIIEARRMLGRKERAND